MDPPAYFDSSILERWDPEVECEISNEMGQSSLAALAREYSESEEGSNSQPFKTQTRKGDSISEFYAKMPVESFENNDELDLELQQMRLKSAAELRQPSWFELKGPLIRTPHTVLLVSPDASYSDIQNSFRKILLQHILFEVESKNRQQTQKNYLLSDQMFEDQFLAFRVMTEKISEPIYYHRTHETFCRLKPRHYLPTLRPLPASDTDMNSRACGLVMITISKVDMLQYGIRDVLQQTPSTQAVAGLFGWTEYTIIVNYCLRRIAVKRRYSEFVRLHKILARQHTPMPPFPNNSTWNSFRCNIARQRMQQLTDYLNNLITSLLQGGLYSPDLMKFLGVNTEQIRREEEARIVKMLDGSAVRAGTPWYMVDNDWLEKWKAFVENKGSAPGPITNGNLLHSNGSIRTGLVKSIHYRCLLEPVWEVYAAIYGGGPCISREHPDINSRVVDITAKRQSAINNHKSTKDSLHSREPDYFRQKANDDRSSVYVDADVSGFFDTLDLSIGQMNVKEKAQVTEAVRRSTSLPRTESRAGGDQSSRNGRNRTTDNNHATGQEYVTESGEEISSDDYMSSGSDDYDLAFHQEESESPSSLKLAEILDIKDATSRLTSFRTLIRTGCPCKVLIHGKKGRKSRAIMLTSQEGHHLMWDFNPSKFFKSKTPEHAQARTENLLLVDIKTASKGQKSKELKLSTFRGETYFISMDNEKDRNAMLWGLEALLNATD